MGACGSRDRVPVIDGAHASEQFCFAAECSLGLHSVEFRSFQAAIKRFGYRMDLNEEHMKSIAPEINLDYEKMQSNRKAGQALLYLDEKFAFLGGKHHVENLILAGWLLTKHWSDETQTTELWHILNPFLTDTVPQKQVIDIIKKILYVGIEMNVQIVSALKDSPEKKNALQYLGRVQANKDLFLGQCREQLDVDVTKE